MQIDTIDAAVVVTAFEACTAFSAPGDGSPLCLACGWLDAEHGPGADVRALARRKPEAQVPSRLAS